jgi:hypothetical protein
VDKDQVLAERRLWMERDGVAGRQEVALQIGIPQWSKRGDEAVCAVAIAGLDENMPPARGRDLYEALVQAVRTLRLHCRKPPAGVRFFYFCESPEEHAPYPGEPRSPEERAAKQEAWEDEHREHWEVLVDRKILMQEDGSDERHQVALQIGHPYRMADGGTFACPVVLKGAGENGEDEVKYEYGRDLFAALSNAVRAVNRGFARPQPGRHLFWLNGEPYRGDHPNDPRPQTKLDPRGIPGSWQVIAERALLMERDGDPRRRRVVIRIGRPYWDEENKRSSCPIQLAGLFSSKRPEYGEDSYTALISALGFFDRHVPSRDPDRRYFWPDGKPYDGEPLYRDPRA